MLDAFDSLILSDVVMPEVGDRAAYLAAMDAWVRAGGNLVLLDGAVRALPDSAWSRRPRSASRSTTSAP